MRTYFTVAKANATLPKVTEILKKLLHIKEALVTISSINIVYDNDEEEMLNITKNNKEHHRLSYEFYSYLEEMHTIGCVLKDLDYGLVDFYAKFEGRDILLCWQLGETEITHWHELDGGFMARKSINVLPKKKEEL